MFFTFSELAVFSFAGSSEASVGLLAGFLPIVAGGQLNADN